MGLQTARPGTGDAAGFHAARAGIPRKLGNSDLEYYLVVSNNRRNAALDLPADYGTAKMSAAVMTSVSRSAPSTNSLPHTT